jgi:hypothetical protein
VRAKADILFGIAGQTLSLEVLHGRPSSVSVEVFEEGYPDSSPITDAITGSASVDSTSTTLDAAATARDTLVPLTSTTGISVGDRLLLTNQLGQTEFIEVDGVDAGVAVYAKEPLQYAYASGDTCVSTLCTVTLDSTWVADESNLSDVINPNARYRTVWTPVVAGKTHRIATYFDLLRYPFEHGVTPLDVERRSMGALSRNPGGMERAEELIEEAALQVRHDLHEHGAVINAQRSSGPLNELIILKSLVLVFEAEYYSGANNERQLDDARKAYWARVENLIPKTTTQVDADGSTAVPGSREPLWSR